MENIGHFLHAWLIFVTPLLYLGYKPKLKKQMIFTVLYGLGVILFRQIYDFLPVPFGTHMVLLSILNAILLSTLLREVDWIKSIIISLIIFTLILCNDSLVLIPLMKYLNITVDKIGSSNVLTYIILWILSNFSLIVACIGGILRIQRKRSYNYLKI